MLNPFQSIEVRLCCPCPHRAAILQKGPHICIIRGNKSRFIVVTPHSLDTSNQKVKSSVPALDCRVYVVEIANVNWVSKIAPRSRIWPTRSSWDPEIVKLSGMGCFLRVIRKWKHLAEHSFSFHLSVHAWREPRSLWSNVASSWPLIVRKIFRSSQYRCDGDRKISGT